MTKRRIALGCLVVLVFAAACTTQGSSSQGGIAAPATSNTVTGAGSLNSHVSLDAGPIVWEWDPDAQPDPLFSEAFREGQACYGSGGRSRTEVVLQDRTFTVQIGKHKDPVVTLTQSDGASPRNPFQPQAWICSVASDGTRALAVGSEVWWTSNGIIWNGVDAFTGLGGTAIYGSNLVWSAVGPMGYVVLGRETTSGWFSPDLETWYEIPVEGGPDYDYTLRGWVGPPNVTISDEMIVIGGGFQDEGSWIGTPKQ